MQGYIYGLYGNSIPAFTLGNLFPVSFELRSSHLQARYVAAKLNLLRDRLDLSVKVELFL
jgi:hypothetical protein